MHLSFVLGLDVGVHLRSERVLVQLVAELDDKLERIREIDQLHVGEDFVVLSLDNTKSDGLENKFVLILLLLEDVLLLKDGL